MRTHMRRGAALALSAALLTGVSACSDLLDVQDPDIVTPDGLTGPSGLETLRAGAIGDFAFAYAGNGGGTFRVALLKWNPIDRFGFRPVAALELTSVGAGCGATPSTGRGAAIRRWIGAVYGGDSGKQRSDALVSRYRRAEGAARRWRGGLAAFAPRRDTRFESPSLASGNRHRNRSTGVRVTCTR